ncbi:MAG: ornithine cyclodeaminase family protein [Betaproteobacteria bacterium]|nr:ornithine cyclodeaminase family protein [Betaproteobacteria bacterium]
MGILILRPDDHKGLLSFGEGVKLVQSGFEDIARSPAKLSNPRTRTNTPEGFRMSVHQGVNPSQRGACTAGRGDRVQVLPDGKQKYIGRGRPVFSLFDTDTADLLMVMIGEPRARGYEGVFCLAGYQTACTAMVGTNLMARPDARAVGVLGAGGQAMMHLAALAETRSMSEVLVYSPTPAKREAFARDMQSRLNVSVRAVPRTETVVEFAEILLVCTNSSTPVLDGGRLRPGTHVTSIVHSNKEMMQAGVIQKMRQEIDDETLRRAELVVTASWVQEELDEPEVLIGAMRRRVIEREKIRDISELINDTALIRGIHARRGITFFKNPGAWGIGIAALLRGFYERAREAGKGIDLGIEGQETIY